MWFESQRVQQISPCPSTAINIRNRELAAQGRDIVDMSLGQPDFDTPAHIIAAAHQPMLEGRTRYIAPQDTLALCKASVAKFKRENGLTYNDDEVIISAPYRVSYSELVSLNGGRHQVIACGLDADYKLTPKLLPDKTRRLILTRGAIYMVPSKIQSQSTSGSNSISKRLRPGLHSRGA